MRQTIKISSFHKGVPKSYTLPMRNNHTIFIHQNCFSRAGILFLKHFLKHISYISILISEQVYRSIPVKSNARRNPYTAYDFPLTFPFLVSVLTKSLFHFYILLITIHTKYTNLFRCPKAVPTTGTLIFPCACLSFPCLNPLSVCAALSIIITRAIPSNACNSHKP